MYKFIESLQYKSDAQKAFYAVSMALIVTALLFGTWGYNLAHSGNITNMASGVAGVAQSAGEFELSKNFSNTLEQLRQISDSNITDAEQVPAVSVDGKSSETSSVGSRQVNVFATPDNMPESTEQYGDNAADELY